MTVLQFYTNVACAAAALVKPGKVWDFEKYAWEDIPAGGMLLRKHLRKAVPFFDVGHLKNSWEVSFQVDPSDVVGASAAIFSTDANLSIYQQIDLFPHQWLDQPVVRGGGWSRTSG